MSYIWPCPGVRYPQAARINDLNQDEDLKAINTGIRISR